MYKIKNIYIKFFKKGGAFLPRLKPWASGALYGELEGVYKDGARGRAWKVPDHAIYHYEDVQWRKYEHIISSSIQQPQVRNDYSTETIPSA